MQWAWLLLLVWSGSWATDWYVRPTDGEYGAENGSSYAAAFDGMNDIVWSTGGVLAGDTLYVCGSFDNDDRDGISNFIQVDVSGSSGNIVTIDGDCSAHETNPSTWEDLTGATHSGAVLDGEGIVSHGIRTMANAFITIQNLEIKNMIERSITLYTNSTTEKTTEKRITVRYTYLHDNTDTVGTSDSMIDGRGTYITASYNLIGGYIPGDGIFQNGTNFTARFNKIIEPGAASSVEGDCILYTENIDGSNVSDNHCEHSTYNEKQCYIINAESGDNGAFTFERNYCNGWTTVAAGTPGGCTYLGSSGAWVARANFMEGCDYGYRIAQMGASSVFSSNISIDALTNGVLVGSAVTAATIENSVSARAGGNGFHSDTAGAAIRFVNNASVDSGAAGFELQDGDNIEHYNSLYGNASTVTVAGVADTPDASDILASPLFVGGPSPDSPSGFRPLDTSPLCGAGTYTDAKYDYNHERMPLPRDIGALNCRSSEARTRTSAGTRTARTVN